MPIPRASLDEPDIPNSQMLTNTYIIIIIVRRTDRVFFWPALIQRPPFRDGLTSPDINIAGDMHLYIVAFHFFKQVNIWIFRSCWKKTSYGSAGLVPWNDLIHCWRLQPSENKPGLRILTLLKLHLPIIWTTLWWFWGWKSHSRGFANRRGAGAELPSPE